MANIRKCKNCYFWDQKTGKYGKCPMIGPPVNLKFAYSEGVVFAMTPRFGVCDNHKYKHEVDAEVSHELPIETES